MTKVNLRINEKLFNKAYLPYLDKEAPRRQIFYGGSSSGKSVFLAQRAVLDVASKKRNYLIARNVQKTVRGSVYNEITKAIKLFKLQEYFIINKTDMVITCVNGYQIIFAGLDDVEKIKSITPQKGVFTDIWVEEATETEKNDIKQLDKRLRGKSKAKKRLTLSFNPIYQDHWIYKEHFYGWGDNAVSFQDENISILKTTYKDNKFLEEDDVKALKDETDKYFYQVYTLGNWGVLGAVIFKNWRTEDLSEIKATFDKIKNGLDFGYGGHPAALTHTHYDKKRGKIYILDELYQTELTNDILANEAKKIIDEQYVVCDSAEPKSIQELKNYGVRALKAKKGPDSVNFGIDWLQRQEIIVHVACQNTRNELQQYKWKEDKDGNVLRVPVDKNNHLIDALRYAYEDEMKQSKWGW